MSTDISADKYCMWTGRSFTEGGAVTMWPVCEPDPVETIHTQVKFRMSDPFAATREALDKLAQAITEQTKAITLLAESNFAIVQAMGESGDIDNPPMDQCL